jgi:DNA-binding IclR family transcriptional regulator
MASLEAVRTRGYEIATGRQFSERLRRTVLGDSARQPGEEPPEFAQVVQAVVERRDPAWTLPLNELSDVTMFAVPVRDLNGRAVLSLGIVNLTGQEDQARLRRYLSRLETAAERATQLVNALPPT